MASWPGEEDVCVQAGKVPGDVCIQGKVPVLFCGGWGAAMGGTRQDLNLGNPMLKSVLLISKLEKPSKLWSTHSFLASKWPPPSLSWLWVSEKK